MSDRDYTKRVEQIENNYFQYEFQYGDEYHNILKEHEKELTEKQKEAIRREVIAFRFSTVDTTQEKTRDRLQPMLGYTDGTSFPDKAAVTEADLDYYRARSLECKNPVMKMRYLDILWELDKREGRHKVGAELVEAALSASNVFDHDNEFERVDCLNRALQVSLQLGKPGAVLATKAIKEIVKHLERLKGSNIRYALELIETVIGEHKHFTKANFELCNSICEVAIKHYTEENDNFTLRGAFIERQFDLKKLLNPQKDDAKDRAKSLAQTQIEEAEKRTDSIIVQQHFLAEAQKILKDAGLNDEAKKLGLRIEKLGKDTNFEQEFKSFSWTQTIPQEEIDKLIELLKKYEDTCAIIAISPNFAPSWANAEKSASEEKENFISDIFSSVTYDDGGVPVAVTSGDTEYRKIIRYFQTETELKVSLLANLLKKLIEEGVITQHNLEVQFEKIKHIDEATWKSIQHGLKLFIEGDPYSASLILVTQLEDFIFRLLPTMEVPQYIQEPDGKTYSPKTLKTMLGEVREALGEDLYQLLYYTLIDKAHLNLRNKAGHGKTKIADDNHQYCVRLIQLFAMLLVHLNIEPKKEG